MFKGLLRYISDKDYRFVYNAAHGMYNNMPDKEFLEKMFRIKMGRELDLDNPLTFNEKLQWLKLYDRKPVYSIMVDKYEAKKYVASIIGDEYIIPTIGVWDNANEIDFTELPNQFVLKCTHDSHGLVICKDKSKLDVTAARKKLADGLKRNYYYRFREWPYKDVKPRIIAETYMEDSATNELMDYKVFCFNGVAKCYKVDFDRFKDHHANYFDMDGKMISIGEVVCPPDDKRIIDAPKNIKLMTQFANLLSKEIPFLRADFYDVDGRLYFGELTFYPASGFGRFIYNGNDEMLGSWVKLPKSIGGGYALISNELLLVFKYKNSSPLKDYKVYTFNGRPELCMINQDRGIHTRADYFDKDYNWLDFTWGYDHADVVPQKPENYELMFELAQRLSVGTQELRVDFYQVNGRVYFGELTFFDGSGFDKIVPIEWDYKLGSMLKLPQI